MTSEQPAHSSSSLLNAQKSRLDALEARIDTLLRVQKEQKPLIKDPSQLIAIAAFIISLMTTIYSWNRDRRQDEAALEIQLRDSLSQLRDLTRGNFELFAKYRDDPTLAVQMAGWGNSQTQLWSREAIYVANRLGDAAPPVEINILANILTTTAEYEQAETFLKKIANKSSADVADKVVAQMTIGSLELQLGKPNDAETYFEAAKKSITSEANYTQGYINNRLANVEIVWASGLVTADCKAAKQHLASAGTYLSKAGPYEKSSANQLSVMNQFMTVACPDEAPTHR